MHKSQHASTDHRDSNMAVNLRATAATLFHQATLARLATCSSSHPGCFPNVSSNVVQPGARLTPLMASNCCYQERRTCTPRPRNSVLIKSFFNRLANGLPLAALTLFLLAATCLPLQVVNGTHDCISSSILMAPLFATAMSTAGVCGATEVCDAILLSTRTCVRHRSVLASGTDHRGIELLWHR